MLLQNLRQIFCRLRIAKKVLVKKGAYYLFPVYDDTNRYERDWKVLLTEDVSCLKLLIDAVNKADVPTTELEVADIVVEKVEE